MNDNKSFLGNFKVLLIKLIRKRSILKSPTKTETVVVSYFFETNQKLELTIQDKQCHIIYQVNKIVMENVQFNYFTDFGLANFAISNLKISKASGSGGDFSEGNIQCDDDLLSWKLISRNADSRPGVEDFSR